MPAAARDLHAHQKRDHAEDQTHRGDGHPERIPPEDEEPHRPRQKDAVAPPPRRLRQRGLPGRRRRSGAGSYPARRVQSIRACAATSRSGGVGTRSSDSKTGRSPGPWQKFGPAVGRSTVAALPRLTRLDRAIRVLSQCGFPFARIRLLQASQFRDGTRPCEGARSLKAATVPNT